MKGQEVSHFLESKLKLIERGLELFFPALNFKKKAFYNVMYCYNIF